MRFCIFILFFVGWATVPFATSRPTGATIPEDHPLDLTEPVACEKIDGYGQYQALPEATLTKDEKLLVYYEPRNHAIERVENTRKYRAHLVQDIRLRRKGEETPLWSREKLVEYEPESDSPPLAIYLSNTIGLKPLPPGEYEVDIILRDELRPGASAMKTLGFRIKLAPANSNANVDH